MSGCSEEPFLPSFTVETPFTGLNLPVTLAFAPDGRLFFNELNTGRVRVIENGQLLAQPFAELPVLTSGERGLIATSDFLRDHWLLLIIGTGAIIYGLRAFLRREEPRRHYHKLLLRLPVIGRLTRGINTARFTRTFSILTGSGVPVLEAMKISSQVIENLPMREAVTKAALKVREGGSISKSLESSKLFPPMMIHLVSTGEAGGRLEEMLTRSADGQEREVDGLIAALLGILQPLLIVIMGAIVLTIVLAILLPIFEINNLIR